MENPSENTATRIADLATSSIEVIKTQAQDTTAKLLDTVEDGINGAKGALAAEGLRLAESLRQTATEYGVDDLPAKALAAVSNGVADLSDGLRGRSIGSVLTDIQAFARRNPATFLAGAAITGFALVSIARSTKNLTSNNSHDPAQGNAKATDQIPITKGAK